uniref:Transposable element P transposase-like RNase H C-terminal domain-containing protein n=1 Tax=Schizaphis graminum TaxID=13262 RepID=A0A2S2PUB1_SCHGA
MITNTKLRLCPKLTDNHLDLRNSSLKMRVRLAVQVLQESLLWLNDWKLKVQTGEVHQDKFLSDNTAEGLRVTLNSTIDITKYLIKEFNFSYVLTGKITQDNLEKFFGTIRLAAGANDHPGTPTFLQLYKLLSVYSLLKPPKFGNCTIDQQHEVTPLITISDIKQTFGNTVNLSALDDLKKKKSMVLLKMATGSF